MDIERVDAFEQHSLSNEITEMGQCYCDHGLGRQVSDKHIRLAAVFLQGAGAALTLSAVSAGGEMSALPDDPRSTGGDVSTVSVNSAYVGGGISNLVITSAYVGGGVSGKFSCTGGGVSN